MNDRYLFRGKRTQNKMWVIGNLTAITDDVMRIATETQNTKGYYVIPKTVGQCTGLRDKNGKLIFEGDIVSYVCDQSKLSDDDLFKHHIEKYIVVWCHNKYCFEEINPEFQRYHEEIFAGYEIIGNKWDNPELLEKQK